MLFWTPILEYIKISPSPISKLSPDALNSDLVNKFQRIVVKPYFSDQFKKIVKRYIRVGYNLDIM